MKILSNITQDLYKAFERLPHELLVAKLHAYGFSLDALRLFYLSNRKQRTKINESYSSWEAILLGVPQGSILGHLFFNIFICDLFVMIYDINIANYEGDSNPFESGDTPLHLWKMRSKGF